MARTIVIFAAGATATLAIGGVLAACTSGNGGTQLSAKILATSRSPAPGTPAGANSSWGYGRPIPIGETEYAVTAGATSLRPGVYQFTVTNNGKLKHAVNFDGPHIDDATTGPLEPGRTGTMTLKLSAGTYRVYCPMPGHRQMGMDTSITVG